MSSSWLATGVLWQTGGWTMLHFLWMGGLFAVVAAIIEQPIRRRSPEVRYSIALTQLIILALIPCCLFIWKLNKPPVTVGDGLTSKKGVVERDVSLTRSVPPGSGGALKSITVQDKTDLESIQNEPNSTTVDSLTSTAPTYSAPTVGAEVVAEPLRPVSITQTISTFVVPISRSLMNILPWVWLVGFPLTCCTLLIGISGAERFRRRCQILNDGHPAVALCRRLQTVFKLRTHILIGVTDRISTPILVGIIRPLILFPTSTLAGISTEQLEMILLHELAHVRRWDNLINLSQRVIEAVLFFHPAVWWISNRVRLEREHCCDAAVLSHINTPQNYAEMLVQMAISNSASDWVLGTSMSHQLIPRIRRILKQEEDRMQVSRKMIVASLSVLLSLAVVTVVNAQRDPAKLKEKPATAAKDVKSDAAVTQNDDESERQPDDSVSGLYKIQEPLDPKKRANAITIKGTVLKEDGTPARRCQVWLAGSTSLPGNRFGATQVAFVRADDKGQFEFWHPSWREHNPQQDEHAILWVFARTRDGVITSNEPLNLTNEYRGKKEIHGLELKAGPKADYSGWVVDENGKPIPDTVVRPTSLFFPPTAENKRPYMRMTEEFTAQYSAVTDSSGKFTLVGLPESKIIFARIAAPGMVEREVRWGLAVPQVSPELRLHPGGTIRGKITNLPAEDFCEHVELVIRPSRGERFDQPEPQFSFWGQFNPQPDGQFEIADVPAGNYELSLAAKKQSFVIPQEFQIPVKCVSKSGQVTDNIQFALVDVITGRGRVVDVQSGEPIANATVRFLKQEQFRSHLGVTTTDANGEYRGYLRPGKIVVEPGRAPNEYLTPISDLQNPAIEYTKDFEAPTFKYERAMTFLGTVVDAEGLPVPAAEIRWFQPGRKGQGFQQTVSSDDSGRFEILQIDPHDPLPLRVRTLNSASTAIVLQANELTDPKPIVVTPENAFRVKGTLTNQRGRPISTATVAVHWHRSYVSKKTQMSGLSGEIEKVKTNAQGQFESSAFWDTDGYHVVIDADGFSKTDLPQVKGELGQTYDYGTVKLKTIDLSLSGKVVDSDGKPISNVKVFNSGDAADIVSTTTDDVGHFQLNGLQDGPVYIFAEHSKYRMAGTYASDPSKEISLTMISLSAPPAQSPTEDLQALDAMRKQNADQLAEWIKEKNLAFRANLRDNKFNALAKTDPDETLAQIAKQSKAMDQRSAILVARSLAPNQPRKKEADDNDAGATKTALRFVERAASRIGDMPPERQIYLKADTGLMFLRLGATDQGKTLMESAAKDFSEFTNPTEYLAVNIAQGLAWYDIPRALSYREKVKEEHNKTSIRNRVIVEVSRYNVPKALELLKAPTIKAVRDFDDDSLKLDLAFRIGGVEPQIAAGLVATIANSRIKAEAAGWAAVAVSDENPELARSLIDQGIEILQLNRMAGQRSFYYEYVPGVAANLVVQAVQVKHPDIDSLVQKVLALRIPIDKGTSSVSRLQSTVNAALYLAFVDPAVAKRLLADLEPELSGKMLGNGGSESVGMQQWLCAWVIADPEKAVALLKVEMEKPRGNEKPPYWIDGAYTLLSLPKSEQLEFVRKYGNAGLSGPNVD